MRVFLFVERICNKEVTCERDNVELEELGAGRVESENFILEWKGAFENLSQQGSEDNLGKEKV